MGKTLIQQARGHGSLSHRVRKAAFKVKPAYPVNAEGEFEVVDFINSTGHTAPIAKLRAMSGLTFFNMATNGIFVGQKINFNGKKEGDISRLGDLDNGTLIFNIECTPRDGGRFVRTGGNSATVMNKEGSAVKVMMPSKEEKIFNENCRATIGKIAGHGRLDKPILKAGKMFFIRKSRNKLWPRTSAIKMNALDHPFGSGRGKRIKSKIAKRNAPPGAKVGLIRPRRTGRRKK